MDAEYTSTRIKINTCPVNAITPDLLALFRSKQLADGKLSFTEQAVLPPPYLDAWDLASYHDSLASAYRIKRSHHG